MIFKSGFDKICSFFRKTIPPIFSSETKEISLDFEDKEKQFKEVVDEKIQMIRDYATAQEVLVKWYNKLVNPSDVKTALGRVINFIGVMNYHDTYVSQK